MSAVIILRDSIKPENIILVRIFENKFTMDEKELLMTAEMTFKRLIAKLISLKRKEKIIYFKN